MSHQRGTLGLRALALAVIMASASGCQPSGKPTVSVPAAPVGVEKLEDTRRTLVQTLRDAKALEPGRLVSHISHTCSLQLGGKRYPIIDLRELVPGETTARGINSILLLSPTLELVQRLDYASERPLFCVANHLYVWGDIWLETLGAEGNELTFGEQGQVESIRHVEANAMPAWPADGQAFQ